MIDYSEGGIVSKEFLHNDAGSLTLFAFDAGQALSEHSAHSMQPYKCSMARLVIKIDGVEKNCNCRRNYHHASQSPTRIESR